MASTSSEVVHYGHCGKNIKRLISCTAANPDRPFWKWLLDQDGSGCSLFIWESELGQETRQMVNRSGPRTPEVNPTDVLVRQVVDMNQRLDHVSNRIDR